MALSATWFTVQKLCCGYRLTASEAPHHKIPLFLSCCIKAKPSDLGVSAHLSGPKQRKGCIFIHVKIINRQKLKLCPALAKCTETYIKIHPRKQVGLPVTSQK